MFSTCFPPPSRLARFVRLRWMWPTLCSASMLLFIVVALTLASCPRALLLIACVAAIAYFTVTMIYQAITLRPATLIRFPSTEPRFGDRSVSC